MKTPGTSWNIKPQVKLALVAAILCSAALLLSIQPAAAQTDQYPAPELLVEFPTPFLAGQAVEVTTNEYAGPKVGNGSGPIDVIEQCRLDSCTLLAQHVRYLEPVNVVPRRAIIVDKKLFDCAAESGSCTLRLLSAAETAVPINFQVATSPLPKESAELAKTDGLTNLEPVELTVKSSLRTSITIRQCASKQGRTFCKKLARRHLAGDATGETATRSITVRPREMLKLNRNRTADCGKVNRRRSCFLIVQISQGHQIGKRIPITFEDPPVL